MRALFRSSVRLANKWKEMEKQVREEATTNRFPVLLHGIFAQGIFKRTNNCGEDDIERHVRASAV